MEILVIRHGESVDEKIVDEPLTSKGKSKVKKMAIRVLEEFPLN